MIVRNHILINDGPSYQFMSDKVSFPHFVKIVHLQQDSNMFHYNAQAIQYEKCARGKAALVKRDKVFLMPNWVETCSKFALCCSTDGLKPCT